VYHHVDLVQYMYMCTIIIMLIWFYMRMMIHKYFIVPDLHDDDGTHVPVLYQIVQYMFMCTIIIMLIWYNKIHVYHHHHVDLVQYMYMCTIIIMLHMDLYCTRSTWWWYTCTCIVPDLHDDGTHVPVLYQIYMTMMIHKYFIVLDLHDDDGTHVPMSTIIIM
jgi:hypothetical protein